MKEIPLRRRDGSVRAYAIVDDDDYELVESTRWSVNATGYAAGGRSASVVLMHRLILGLEKGDPRVADHINLEKLDNRRENLRILPGRKENRQNLASMNGSSSKYRGVAWHKKMGKWAAKSHLDGKYFWHGAFDSEEEAAEVAAAFRATHMPFSAEAFKQ